MRILAVGLLCLFFPALVPFVFVALGTLVFLGVAVVLSRANEGFK